jgi:hypothetical protein
MAHAESPAPAPHRFQVFRQAKNGVHYNHGSRIASAEEAVENFLETPPLFDGGDIRLWDHREGRAVASADWLVESTRFGFAVRVRANAFFDEEISRIANRVVEREAYFRSIAQRVGMAG